MDRPNSELQDGSQPPNREATNSPQSASINPQLDDTNLPNPVAFDTSRQAARAEFARDPHVADSNAKNETHSFRPPPKTVEEILESINGYQPETVQESVAEDLTHGTHGDTPIAESTECHEPGSDEENMNQMLPENEFDEHSQPEFDVRTFQVEEPEPEETPAPIRGAFEVDHDLFDYESVSEIESTAIREPQIGCETGTGKLPRRDDRVPVHSVNSDNQFWADCGDVIRIDGDDGYGYIDLACFDFKDATFQDNQIRIACDDGLSFLIEYRNIPHALFANGVKVELDGAG